MKKYIALLLAMSLTVGCAFTVFANDTITIVDDNAQTEETKTEETKVEDTQAEAAEAKEEKPAEEAAPAQLTVAENKTYLALGQDLTQDQLNAVLSLMGITADKLANYNVVYVTNADEHAYLDTYLDPAVIGKRSLSSVLVRPASTGHGVTVTTHNINYCTESMYQNALITAGVTDAEVIVVAPSQISGTAALIGALKAYSAMTGLSIPENALDTALDELVTTGAVSDALGDDKAATELISYIKAQIAANDLNTKEEIEAAVRKGNEELKANLTEEQIQQIVDVMLKIKAMGIDFDVLAEQADAIYAKYGDQIKAGTFNIDDVDWADLGIGKIISNAVGNFLKNVGDSVKGFFGAFLGKKK